jgi:hypothetical protein
MNSKSGLTFSCVTFSLTPKAMTVLLFFLIFLAANSNGQDRKVFLSLFCGCCFSHFTTFNTETEVWSWIHGSDTQNQNGEFFFTTFFFFMFLLIVLFVSGIYGIQGTGTTSTVPGGRYSASSWTDVNGTLWLFGGYGYESGSSGECFSFFLFEVFEIGRNQTELEKHRLLQ